MFLSEEQIYRLVKKPPQSQGSSLLPKAHVTFKCNKWIPVLKLLKKALLRDWKQERAGLSERLNRDKAPPFQEGTIQALFKISKSERKLMKKQTALCFSSGLENSGSSVVGTLYDFFLQLIMSENITDPRLWRNRTNTVQSWDGTNPLENK